MRAPRDYDLSRLAALLVHAETVPGAVRRLGAVRRVAARLGTAPNVLNTWCDWGRSSYHRPRLAMQAALCREAAVWLGERGAVRPTDATVRRLCAAMEADLAQRAIGVPWSAGVWGTPMIVVDGLPSREV